MIAVGGASWSITDDAHANEPRSIATIHAALDAGVRVIDTARAYTTVDDGAHNEKLIARALVAYGSERLDAQHITVVTKGGHYRLSHDVWAEDGSPAALRADVESSLDALGVDRLDVFLLHKPDARVPIEESIGAIAELQAEGKIERIGVSNVDTELLSRALAEAPLDAVENSFSPFRQDDRPVLEQATALGMTYFAYSPLKSERGLAGSRDVFPESLAIADSLGISPQQLWLAWLQHQSPVLVPVVGSTSPATITDSAAAASLALPSDCWPTLERELAELLQPTSQKQELPS
ncbi:aldo/keto reductase [Subtercola endophyticus]|uniref:aldo/keto reductase n=1 Tax=Subtercola endophyticus TaxID=2895559 RepID=UPI001E43D64D|nr:aldo/keto reductase [Subtercola endophyticus]UFS58567.1 aldo/keto reductase [Subtercola endophyticus]